MKKVGFIMTLVLCFSLIGCGSSGKIENGVWKCSSIEQFALSDGVSVGDIGYLGTFSNYVEVIFDLDGHKSNGTGRIFLEEDEIVGWRFHCSKEVGDYWFDKISENYTIVGMSNHYEFIVKDSDVEGKAWGFEIDLPDSENLDDGYSIEYCRKKGSMDMIK